MQTSQDQNRSNVQSPTSTAATDELTMKIESAKNLWDEDDETTPPAPKPSFSEGNLVSQTLGSITTSAVSEQQQHRGDTSREMNAIGDLNAGHLGHSHSAGSILPVSGPSGITFGSFPTSDVDLVENDAPTSASFNTLSTSMGASMDSGSMEMSVPSSRGFVQFSTANKEPESPPEVTSAGYNSNVLSLYLMPSVSTGSGGGALPHSSILSHSSYENKHIGGEHTRVHHHQQQQQTYTPSVLLAQPFNLGSSLSSNLAIPVGSVGGNIGGNSQSVLSQSASGQYSFQGHDTSRLLPGTPAFLTPAGSFQGTIIQPQSGSLQFGLNQSTALAPSSPAPGAPSQQTHQSYPQAAAASFLQTQPAPQPAPHSGLHTNFGPILSGSLSQQPPVHSPYMSLSSPSYTRPSHDMGLSSGHTTSVIMKPQNNMEGLTKTVSSVPMTVPAVQTSHLYSQVSISMLCHIHY